MILFEILKDAFFAGIAAIGFGAISDPPRRAYFSIALLSAVGHSLRFCLMECLGTDIATASFAAAFSIGMGSLILGRRIYCPATVLYIPALLPMIPGIYAYKIVFSLIMFLQHMQIPDMQTKYMTEMFTNSIVTCSVIFNLSVGASLPLFIFKKMSISMTRKGVHPS